MLQGLKMVQGCIKITDEGKFAYQDYKPESLSYTILVILYTNPCTMLQLVDRVRHEKDAFRFIQPKEIIRVIVELEHSGYLVNTYED